MRRRERHGHGRRRFPRFLLRILFSLVGAVFLFYLIVLITAWIH